MPCRPAAGSFEHPFVARGGDIPERVLHEPAGSEERYGQIDRPKRLFERGALAQQVLVRCIRTDGRQANHPFRPSLGQGRNDSLDNAHCLGKARFGIEFGWRQNEDCLGTPEGGGKTCRIVHVGNGDVAALGFPFRCLGLVAQNGTNGEFVSEQAACNCAAHLAGNSGDRIHGASPKDR